jgi:hypothetical protein
MSPHRLRFAHRHNVDDSFDSICERCLQTVVSADSESSLSEFELVHRCTEEDLRLTLTEMGASRVRAQLDAILRSTESRPEPPILE